MKLMREYRLEVQGPVGHPDVLRQHSCSQTGSACCSTDFAMLVDYHPQELHHLLSARQLERGTAMIHTEKHRKESDAAEWDSQRHPRAEVELDKMRVVGRANLAVEQG